MNRFIPLAFVAAVLLAGCDSFKEAMTAHVDVAAKAGSQELSVTRLAEMMGNNPQVPINKDVAKQVATVWVNYQLLGQAAAQGDSLNDPRKIDAAMQMLIDDIKRQKFGVEIAKTFVADTNVTDAQYAQGDVLSAQHILFMVPEGASPAKADSIRRKAEAVRAQATSTNFGALAARHSEDPGSKDRGGLYAAFPRGPAPGSMVPEFEKGVAALKPGEIGPLVRTSFGYHIIRRSLLPEVRKEFAAEYGKNSTQDAESTYVANLLERGKVDVKAKGPEIVRAIATDLDAHRDDKSVIATSTAGTFTAGELAEFMRSIPPQEQMQLRQQIAQVPDSLLQQFIKLRVLQELMLDQADSAKVGPDSTELSQMRTGFAQMVQSMWQQLGVAPTMLADSAKSESDRERLAASRVEQYMDNLIRGQAQYIVVQEPLERLLREEYNGKVADAGIDRAVERALALRAVADSVRAGQPRPPSAVPMPGQAPPPGGLPAGGPPPAGRGAPPPGDR